MSPMYCVLLTAAAVGSRGTLTDDSTWYRSRRTGRVQFSPPAPPPPPFPVGLSFSATLTDNAVLQRGTASRAAVYGVVVGPSTSERTKVTITVYDAQNFRNSPTKISAEIMTLDAGKNLTWKALLPPHADYGGNFDVSGTCTNCDNETAVAIIKGLTYGDVWFCSGQSNMELMMAHALTRNRTYTALDERREYTNIRIFDHADHVARYDGDEVYILFPSSKEFAGWQLPNSTILDSFSATCWFFAQELTDMALTANKTPPVIGLIQSAWGGTEIDDWIVNSSISECKNASGAPEPNRQGNHGAVYPDDGALNNGMVAPFLNYTIFGALWYQGENNVQHCLPINEGGGDSNLNSCGNVLNSTGYACAMKNLVVSWRRQWSVTPQTTDAQFPFGIVSLAAGTSEGHSANMPNFRLAQTASYGFLPGPPGSGMEKTFIAQAYDAGDPGVRSSIRVRSELDSPYQANYDSPFPGRVGYSANGHQSFTQQYMGGLHPRAKQTIGRRLALAASAVAYEDVTTPFTGPVFRSCSVAPEGTLCFPGSTCKKKGSFSKQRQITINFREDLLLDDAVHVWPTTPGTEGLAVTAMYNCINSSCLTSCGRNVTCVTQCASLNTPGCQGWASIPVGPSGNGLNPSYYDKELFHYSTGKTVSPLEVQLNHTLWMPAQISFNAGFAGGDPINRNCRPGICTNYSRVDGWSSLIATAPTAIPIGCSDHCPPVEQLRPGQYCVNCTATFVITGVRYAWADDPCCGGDLNRNVIPCPVNSCPVSTYNSTLPAVPFMASVVMTNDTKSSVGSCVCQPPQDCS